MSWQDDPVVEQQSAQPAWMADPVVSEQPPAAPQPAPADNRPVGDISDAILEPLRAFGSSAIATPLAGLAGLGAAGTHALGLTETQPAQVVENVQSALTYQPRTKVGQSATNLASYPFEKLAQGADFLGQKTLDATGSPALATAVNTATQAAPGLLLKGKPAKVLPDGNRGAPNVARPVVDGETPPQRPSAPKKTERPAGLEGVRKAAPSIDDLSTQAKAAYKKAEDAGVVISKDSFAGLQKQIQTEVGRTADPTLHPDTSAALKRILDEKGDVSLEKLDTLRQIANDAKGSVKPADKRLASMIVEKIDDYVERMGAKDVVAGDASKAAALKEARNLYSRKMKAQEIQQLIQRAEDSAPNFSASGLENALRTEFRALVKNPKKLRRFNAEEQAAIRKVARGGPIENTLRMIGKMAPTGAVSGLFGIASSALVPGGAALPIAGLASRYAATRMTRRNALAAEELMRRGPQNSIKQSAKKRNALLEY